jgi:hypothetical protein
MVIEIPLSKTGKYANKYVAIVSDEDAVLANYDWYIFKANTSNPYAARFISRNGKRIAIYLHRAVMERMLGEPIAKGMEVDHINGIGLCDTRDNLRIATKSENAANRKTPDNNAVGYKGVSWNSKSKKYQVYIQAEGRAIFLGLFSDPKEAHTVYAKAAQKYFGEFARFEE